MSLNAEDLKKLKAPFDSGTICVKVQALSKNKDKAGLVVYVQHTDVYSRIDEVDPGWSSEVTSVIHHPAMEHRNEFFNVRVKLTIKGVSRENSGEGDDLKSATSDAMKRAAMLFGVTRYLYDTETVWVPYDKDRDFYRIFTIDEYHAALRPGQVRVPLQAITNNPEATQKGQSASRSEPAVFGPKKSNAPAIVTSKDAEKRQLAKDILVLGSNLNWGLDKTKEYILEYTGKPFENLTLEELSYLKIELTRQYEGV